MRSALEKTDGVISAEVTHPDKAVVKIKKGKTNADIATILGITESTVKKHVQEIFEKLGVETRCAAAVRALELLNSPEPAPPSRVAADVRRL